VSLCFFLIISDTFDCILSCYSCNEARSSINVAWIMNCYSLKIKLMTVKKNSGSIYVEWKLNS
jgi:hypothetical protein